MKRRILCFGDSNTWGYVAEGPQKTYVVRQPEESRWPMVAGRILGAEYEVLEEGMNARTTAFDDPYGEGRNGLAYLQENLPDLLPLEAAVIALGINDLKPAVCGSVPASREAMGRILRLLKKSGIEQVILVLPAPPSPAICEPPFKDDFALPDILAAAASLSEAYSELTKLHGIACIETKDLVRPGPDGLHLTSESHRRLGQAVAQMILERANGCAPA